MEHSPSSSSSPIAELVARARAAQRIYETWTQAQVDTAVVAAGWAIVEPARNRELAELAVADTGVGNVEDKVRKNHRKTFGLLRDLHGARSVGVIAEDPARGIVEIARPVGVVCAITPSTNPGATPANKIINALKGRNAVIVAPSPKGWSTAARLIEFIHRQFDRIGAPRDLVQLLPAPVNKQSTAELMRLCDLVVATGSQANVRAAYASGTPAFGVGAGNVAGIVDETADVQAAADRIVRSKTFDNATSCSSENSLVIVDAVRAKMLSALKDRGAVMLADAQKATLQKLMWPEGKLSAAVIGQSARAIAERAAAVDGANRAAWMAIAEADPRILMVAEDGVGHDHPFSGEKLSPVLAVYAARDFDEAAATVARIYSYEGAGHSVGLHSAVPERALALGLTLPVSRVIVDQAHCIATGGSFDNGLPFSLSMGCGTWGKNNFSDNMNYRHYLNITRVSRPIPEVVPSEEEIFGAFFASHGAK
ncbi:MULTISPECIES: acylating sulfoacetaldehyde dehydrogenase [Variovorax]|jgi:sulfoacetaldehyde dehydrogenase|uniref:acylating sulfoacetaldehyde dehydrogenase n=1 Tax=Variovorax TaxID=34072 RepID=UPI00086CC24C|nr:MULTISPECIES: aldehyde dehydrogenase family protein [Variovorax]MBN8757322.1 aldehyde dehydrogenase family protein [Variovorax sp.]ODU17962.1 MAG: sulfoacetaldehyde dehydrogenase [Variovorax sp. SCN 67-85]ODV24497.1 MAG: sulfoacetaldehyde dehydrogenase [Variovorax sp. SCN 67-20]OJZ13760.1 MAG: sulfoacetaldehyde dehydrogenase [Variovorax sp. 67-131]UKI06212.1 aldehyde dehydrogenase family protein [Variovorax paradoxus]